MLLNRRGFATAVFCRQCGDTLDCPNCSVSLTVHGKARRRRARCHYCNYSARVPTACPHCAGPYLEQIGFGTERVEAEVARAVSAARASRARSRHDPAPRRARRAAATVRRSGEIDVLVGTQMIAKGHDFPRVTLVGVISADVGLGLADFRAAERTFQLLTQVAGRAGRGERAAARRSSRRCIPTHYSIQLACRQDYAAFYEEEIAVPPGDALSARCGDGQRGRQGADLRRRRWTTRADLVRGAARWRRGIPRAGTRAGAARAACGEHRAQFFLKGTQPRAMREALRRRARRAPELARRTIVDVDPMNVLYAGVRNLRFDAI